MALLDDMFKGGNVLTGAAIGLGTLVLAPTILPLLRGTAKFVVKTGMVAYEEGRSAMAGLGDKFGGVVQEAREELARDRAHRAQPVHNTATSDEEPSRAEPPSRGKAAASPPSESTEAVVASKST